MSNNPEPIAKAVTTAEMENNVANPVIDVSFGVVKVDV